MKDLIDHSTIHFSSAIDDSSGVVYVRWLQGQYEGYWEAEIAINLATALLLVAGVALAEATLSEALLQSQDLAPSNEDYKIKQAQVLHLIRSTRMEIHPQLQPIFGYNTQQPLVEIGWYKTERTTTIEGAIEEAKIMLEAANTAIIDGLLSKSLAAAGIKDRLRQKVFQKMREARG